MALQATVYNFDVELADSDRGVYESLALRVARHPSESEEYLVARLIAYLMEFTEGITFSRGVSEPDEPAIAVRDLTGVLATWIDVGTPDAARLHKASKSARRVVVYTHKDPRQFLKGLAGEKIHRADASVFSFHAVKIVTAAEGGIVTTRDPSLAERLRLLRQLPEGIRRAVKVGDTRKNGVDLVSKGLRLSVDNSLYYWSRIDM